MALTAKEELELLREEKRKEMAFLVDYLIPAHERITGKSPSSGRLYPQSKSPKDR